MSTEGGRVSVQEKGNITGKMTNCVSSKRVQIFKRGFKCICLPISHCVCMHKSMQVPAEKEACVRSQGAGVTELQGDCESLMWVLRTKLQSSASARAASTLQPPSHLFSPMHRLLIKNSHSRKRKHHEPGNETESLWLIQGRDSVSRD